MKHKTYYRKFRHGLSKKMRDKIDARWDIKMIHPVMDFVQSVLDNVNPRLKKLAKKDEYIINGVEIEEEMWKLLRKTRRITQMEKAPIDQEK